MLVTQFTLILAQLFTSVAGNVSHYTLALIHCTLGLTAMLLLMLETMTIARVFA
jgi:hypothetical protein